MSFHCSRQSCTTDASLRLALLLWELSAVLLPSPVVVTAMLRMTRRLLKWTAATATTTSRRRQQRLPRPSRSQCSSATRHQHGPPRQLLVLGTPCPVCLRSSVYGWPSSACPAAFTVWHRLGPCYPSLLASPPSQHRYEDWTGVRAVCAQAAALGTCPPDLPSEAEEAISSPTTGAAATSAYLGLPTAAARAEFAAADAEAVARIVDDALAAALAAGSTASLQDALATADAAGPSVAQRPATQQLAASVRLLLRARSAVQAGDDASLAAALAHARLPGVAAPPPPPPSNPSQLRAAAKASASAATTGASADLTAVVTVHPLAAPEVTRLFDAMHERASTAGLRAALSSGGPRWFEQQEGAQLPPQAWAPAPTGPAADLGGLQLAELDAAVVAAAGRSVRSAGVRRLLGSARLLVSLRTCALGDDWEGLLARLEDARAAGVWLGPPGFHGPPGSVQVREGAARVYGCRCRCVKDEGGRCGSLES
jgi:hypothetical protein